MPPNNPSPGILNAIVAAGVLYVFETNGCYTTYTGGSVAWRNSNPGNLSGTPERFGQIGIDENGKAIFEDEDAGRKALEIVIADAGRGLNKPLSLTLDVVATENGWSPTDLESVKNAVQQGGAHMNEPWNSGLQPDNMKDMVLNKIGEHFGVTTAGEQSNLICPDAGSQYEE